MESTFWKLSIGLDEAAIKRIGLEHAGTAVNDVIERRGADVDRNAGLITQAHVETAQQRAATRAEQQAQRRAAACENSLAARRLDVYQARRAEWQAGQPLR